MPEKVKETMDLKCDCVMCREEKQVITICHDCWRLIRKALEIKGKDCRENWEGWGYGIISNLDLSTIVKLLITDKEGQEILEKEGKGIRYRRNKS